jgi:PAS domain S-box-containing protein
MTRDIVTVTPECSLEKALSLMADRRISTLVVTENGRPVGMATEEDLLSLVTREMGAKNKSIAEADISLKLTLSPRLNTLEAAVSMERANARAAVVTDEAGKLLGLVTITDILRRLSDEDFVTIQRVKHSISMSGEKVFVSQKERVGDCILKMVKAGIDCVVVTYHSKPVGIFTRRDAVRLLSKGLKEAGGKEEVVPQTREPVSMYMTEQVITVSEELPLAEATNLMEEKSIRRLVVVDESGRLRGLITQKDIVKRLDANYAQIMQRVVSDTRDQLHLSEAKYQTIIESSIEPLYVIRGQTIAYLNPSMVELLGCGQDDMSGRKFLEIVHPDDRSRVRGEIEERMKQPDNANPFRFRALKCGGGLLVIESVCRRIRENDDELLIGFARDVTAQTLRQEELERENRVMSLLNRLSELFADGGKNPDERLNDACSEILTFNEAECCSFAITAGPHPDSASIIAGAEKTEDGITMGGPRIALRLKENEDVRRAMNDKTAVTFRLNENGCGKEIANKMKHASACSLVVVPMLVNDAPIGVLGFGFKNVSYNPTETDIKHFSTIANHIGAAFENSRLNLRLRNSEAQYRELFDSSVDIVIMTDKQGIIEDINAQFTVSTGYDMAEWIGKPFKSLLAGSDQPGSEHLDRCEERFAGAEFVLHTHYGEKYFYISSWPRYGEGGDIVGNWRMARDVTDTKHNLMELIKAKEKAEEASSLKSRFLANVSHELRTPLTAIIGFSNLISTNEKIAEEIKEQGRIVARQGKYLLKLINNMLDLVQLEKGPRKLEQQDVKIADIVGEAVERERENAELKGITFGTEVDPLLPNTIVTDERKLSVILDQLINNAVKFTKSGSITIYARPEGSQLVFEVKDPGIGIDEKKLLKIFDSFYQADSSSTRRYGGAGLGLPLARAVLSEMGGSIWVKSAPGAGSSFFFSIPLVVKPTTAGHGDKTGVRMLIANEEATISPATREMLDNAGYEPQVVENGEEAVKMCREKQFDVILLNVKQPVKTSCETVKRIKEIPGYRVVPTIALAGDAVAGDRESLLTAGFDYFLEEPFRPLDLLNRIETALPDKQPQHG